MYIVRSIVYVVTVQISLYVVHYTAYILLGRIYAVQCTTYISVHTSVLCQETTHTHSLTRDLGSPDVSQIHPGTGIILDPARRSVDPSPGITLTLVYPLTQTFLTLCRHIDLFIEWIRGIYLFIEWTRSIYRIRFASVTWNTIVPVVFVRCTVHQCTVYSVRCTMYSVQCTVYGVPLYNVLCTLYGVQCTMDCVRCIIYGLQYCTRRTVYGIHSILYKICRMINDEHCTLYSVHVQYSSYSVRCRLYIVQRIPYDS